MGLKGREEKSPSERWVDALKDMTASTRNTYRRELNDFLRWAEEDESGLVSFWLETRDEPGKNMSLSDAMNDYLEALDDRGLGGGKQNAAVKSVRKFFKINGFAPVLDVKPRASELGAKIATKDDIRKLLAYSIDSPRTQSIITITKDSGLRVSDICDMKIKDIQPLLDDPSLQWHIFKKPILKTRRQGKVGLPALGPDAVKYLRVWLDERVKLGLGNADPEAYLFVNVKETSDYTTIHGDNKGSTLGTQIDHNNASMLIITAAQRAGLHVSANSLRKFMTTRLSVGGLSESMVKYVQGKHQGSSTENYLDFQASEILPKYQEAYPEIAIEGEEVRELEELQMKQAQQNGEVDTLRQQVADLTRRMDSIATATNQMGELKDGIEEEIVRYIDLAQNDPDQLINELKEAQDHPRYKKYREKKTPG